MRAQGCKVPKKDKNLLFSVIFFEHAAAYIQPPKQKHRSSRISDT